MQRTWVVMGVLGMSLATAGPARAEVLITELMYDPASPEVAPVKTEWVEIYNTGEQTVQLAGWYLQDEDARTERLPAGVSIEPGQAIVLIPDGCTAEAFQAAWGDDVVVHPLAKWAGHSGTLGLANTPSETNEVLTLRSAANEVVDEVNYQEKSPWPDGKTRGASIYLLSTILQAEFNDEGARWRFSEAGTHGAKAATATDLFDADDVGSPGAVAPAEDE